MSDHVGERCDHVPFFLIITFVAVHVGKVAHPKYSKMVILENMSDHVGE